MTTEEATLESLHNEMLVNLDKCLPDIRRLSSEPVVTARDAMIVEMCLLFLSGMLMKRRDEAERME